MNPINVFCLGVSATLATVSFAFALPVSGVLNAFAALINLWCILLQLRCQLRGRE